MSITVRENNLWNSFRNKLRDYKLNEIRLKIENVLKYNGKCLHLNIFYSIYLINIKIENL